MATVTLEQELNPWLAQEARFDYAAKKLNLERGLWKVLSEAGPGADCAFSGEHG